MNLGFIGDVDIGSEKLRIFGKQRFNIYGYYWFLQSRKYRVKIWMLNNDEDSIDDVEVDISKDDPRFTYYEGPIYNFYSSQFPFLLKNGLTSPSIKEYSSKLDVQIFKVEYGKTNFFKYLYDHWSFDPKKFDYMLQKQTRAFRIDIENKKHPNFVLDGENLQDKKLRRLQMEVIPESFTILI